KVTKPFAFTLDASHTAALCAAGFWGSVTTDLATTLDGAVAPRAHAVPPAHRALIVMPPTRAARVRDLVADMVLSSRDNDPGRPLWRGLRRAPAAVTTV